MGTMAVKTAIAISVRAGQISGMVRRQEEILTREGHTMDNLDELHAGVAESCCIEGRH